MSKNKIAWKEASEADDYDAALKYLSLIFPVAKSQKLVRALQKSSGIDHAAKDLLRASNLPMLSRDEAHVDEDLKKIGKGKPLVPVLLVRGDMALGVPLIVADGYHRICAVCYYDESAPVACRLVNF
jgi:hypothetical protein